MDVNELINALENDNNEHIINLSYKEELQKKHNVLDDLELTHEEKEEFLKKLKNYIYVDEMPAIHHGSYMRWIPLKDPERIYLTTGGHVCDINICQKGSSIVCKCKSFKKPIFLQVRMDEAFLFRKLNEQEQILMQVIQYLEEKEN
tara:strand:- start:2702 stop:3139 length:438 start_codon:yes stop_codon:yes gene_type:complete